MSAIVAPERTSETEGVRALTALAVAMRRELVHGILPYWLDRALDVAQGGVVGLIDGNEMVHADAPKGAILNARVLWTFSAAARALGDHDGRYRAAADHAARFVRDRLVDPTFGGVYWMVNADGTPRDTRKHVYAQAFAIYALSEHYRATGDERSLQGAIALFHLVEQHAYDVVHGGYEEAFSREWALLDDVRLSAEDADERKSMNTHLHVLEAYATLYRVWPDALLRERLTAVAELFLTRIIDAPTGHLGLFFDSDWTPKSDAVSFGHDIEATWLLLDAADALGDAALRARLRPACVGVATAVLQEAYDVGTGGIFYEVVPGAAVVTDKEWWPQAEAIVGFVDAWQETGASEFLNAARETWAFTERHLLDHVHGEWRRRVSRDGVPCEGYEKVGPWKCPYHNARACLEVMARAETMVARREERAA